jgi:hypothetical protein
MSNIENNAHQSAAVTDESLGAKAARWIDDPVGSVVAGIAFPTAAVSVVIGGIWGLGFVY